MIALWLNIAGIGGQREAKVDLNLYAISRREVKLIGIYLLYTRQGLEKFYRLAKITTNAAALTTNL